MSDEEMKDAFLTWERNLRRRHAWLCMFLPHDWRIGPFATTNDRQTIYYCGRCAKTGSPQIRSE